MNKKLKWAIIGGGNGGHAAAGHLGIQGYSVRMKDISKEVVDTINKQGGIHVQGALEGFGKVDLASTNITDVVLAADIIMVVLPATLHKIIAQELAPYLRENQIIFLHPGATFGALEFYNTLEKYGKIPENLIICEALSLLYACRTITPGNVNIVGFKNSLKVAAFPGNKTNQVVELLKEAFPQIEPAKNVLETSLCNLNAIMHPAPSILNTSLIESNHDWEYYNDGITPTIGKFLVELDKERIAIGEKLNLNLLPVKDFYKSIYNVKGDTLTEIVRSNSAYKGIKGQKQIDTRYILEDIPTGLIPMMSLGKKLNLNTLGMETICNMAKLLLNVDFKESERTVETAGIEDLDIEQLIEYVETGKKSR
jgi:opine dehydrogenase